MWLRCVRSAASTSAAVRSLVLTTTSSQPCAAGLRRLVGTTAASAAGPTHVASPAVQDSVGAAGVPLANFDIRALGWGNQARKVRDELAASPRSRITVDEYAHLCARHGLSRADGDTLLKGLNTVGDVLYIPTAADDRLRTTIFLHPQQITDDVFARLGVGEEYRAEQTQRLQSALAVLEGQQAAMDKVKTTLDRKAQRHTKGALWALFAGLTVQFGVYAHLTWFVFSWDVMEPITFFVGQVFLIGVYSYFAYTKRDWDFDELYKFFYTRKQKRLFQKHGFDIQRYTEIGEEIGRYRAQLDALKSSRVWH